VASLLDLNKPNPWIIELNRALFMNEYLGVLEEVVNITILGVGIPTVMDMRWFIDSREMVLVS
jgi:hypothetical protein